MKTTLDWIEVYKKESYQVFESIPTKKIQSFQNFHVQKSDPVQIRHRRARLS